MHPPDVHGDRAEQKPVSYQVEDAAWPEADRDLGQNFGFGRAVDDDVVEAAPARLLLPERGEVRPGDVADCRDGSGLMARRDERRCVAVQGRVDVDDQQPPPVQKPVAVGVLVGRHDAGPRLHQGGLHIAGAFCQGQQIAALVALQDFFRYHAVLGHAAVELVAVGGVRAPVIHVGLHDEPLPDLKLACEVLPHPSHGQGDLVSHNDRVRVHVPPLQTRVLRAEIDDLDVGEADAAGVVPHQQLVRAVGGQGDGRLPQRFQARPVQVPALDGLRQRPRRRPVLFQSLGHGRGFRRAERAFLPALHECNSPRPFGETGAVGLPCFYAAKARRIFSSFSGTAGRLTNRSERNPVNRRSTSELMFCMLEPINISFMGGTFWLPLWWLYMSRASS